MPGVRLQGLLVLLAIGRLGCQRGVTPARTSEEEPGRAQIGFPMAAMQQ
jgi:hypothetical protein